MADVCKMKWFFLRKAIGDINEAIEDFQNIILELQLLKRKLEERLESEGT